MGVKSECPNCLEVFNGLSSFDRHRIGVFSQRRCLTVPELQRKGFVRGRYGHWSLSGYTHQAPRTEAMA